MKTIENLRIPKEVTRKTKDENGHLIEVTETKMVARVPNTVEMGPRFGYYLIDLVFFYVLSIIIGILLTIFGFYDAVTDPVWGRVISVLVFVGYFFILELATGATLGKLMLGYTVIDVEAEKPSAGRLLGRSFARLIPFEPFSCLGERGWHDSVSNTYVVKRAEKEELRRLLGKLGSDNDILD